MSARARSAGGISVAHSASCGVHVPIETKLAKASDIIAPAWIVANKFMSPLWGSGSMSQPLPTACAVGYKYFVGYANWLSENPNVYCKVGNESGHTEN